MLFIYSIIKIMLHIYLAGYALCLSVCVWQLQVRKQLCLKSTEIQLY